MLILTTFDSFSKLKKILQKSFILQGWLVPPPIVHVCWLVVILQPADHKLRSTSSFFPLNTAEQNLLDARGNQTFVNAGNAVLLGSASDHYTMLFHKSHFSNITLILHTTKLLGFLGFQRLHFFHNLQF